MDGQKRLETAIRTVSETQAPTAEQWFEVCRAAISSCSHGTGIGWHNVQAAITAATGQVFEEKNRI